MKHINEPLTVLKEVYGYDSFRPLQDVVIDSILESKDTVAIFKTSGGKSLCYQIPALCVEGTAIVISPLISLMKDQVDTLEELGVPAAYVNSTQTFEERNAILSNYARGEYKLFYVSPERLSEDFFALSQNVNVSFLAVDEAHCVSMYGHDFRPSYTKIGSFFDALADSRGKSIPRIALTATAPEDVRDDIKNLLGMKDVQEFLGSFERENIDFIVRHTEDKTQATEEIIRQFSSEPIIIYCATVKSVDALYSRLIKDNYPVARYHGQLTAVEKEINQEAFIRGDINVMIATCAFGMGVDKSDVRTVVHYQMPGDLEAYYQEAGRAGRDGKQSRAILLYSKNDRSIQDYFIANTYPSETELLESLNFINLFAADQPITEGVEFLAQACPGDIDTPKMLSILRILSDHKLIDMTYSNEDSNTVLIDRVDYDVESVDFSYIGARRRIALNSLMKMIDYAKTTLCRTKHVMKHFDQRMKSDCGHCDNCFNKRYFLDKNAYVPLEYVHGALVVLKGINGNFSMKTVIDVFKGTRNNVVNAANLQKIAGFGTFDTWTESGIEDLVSALKKEGYVGFKDGDKPYVTSSGSLIIAGEEQPKIKLNLTQSSLVTREMFYSEVVKRSTMKQASDASDSDLDYNFIETLKSGRSYLSKHFNITPNVLISDKTLVEISRKRPTDLNELVQYGMNEELANKYGTETLSVLNVCYKKHSTAEDF